MQTTPSSLSDIHSFLAAHQAAPPAWSSPRARLDALLALLNTQRNDDAFWSSLSTLLQRLEDRRISPALVQGAEVLDGASLEEVLRALRRALRASKPVRLSALGQLQPLASFAVLAIALFGCGDKADTEGCDEATAVGLSADAASVYCEILSLIASSEAGDADKEDLIDCLPDLSDARREALLAEFAAASDDELVALIAVMATSDECSDEDDTWGTH